MKREIRKHILVWAMLCSAAARVAALQQNPAPATAPIAGATVADVKGKVQVELPGQDPSAPSRGKVLPAETVITTQNGRILLRLEDASQILVNSNTRLVLRAAVGHELATSAIVSGQDQS